MASTPRCELRILTESDLDLLLDWRNSDQVRRYMYSSHRIEGDEHRRWYEAVRADVSRHPMIFELDGRPAGFVNIGPVKDGGVADWGFYAAPNAPRGTGRLLGIHALTFAFDQLRLHKVCGEALDFNEASRRFHLRLGFRQEGELVDQHFDGAAYHDVIRFGLLASDWELRNREDEDESTT